MAVVNNTETLKWQEYEKFLDDAFANIASINDNEDVDVIKQHMKEELYACTPEKIPVFLMNLKYSLLCTRIANEALDVTSFDDNSDRIIETKLDIIAKLCNFSPEKIISKRDMKTYIIKNLYGNSMEKIEEILETIKKIQ